MLTDIEKQNFLNNGFIGPFKIYKPEQAKKLLRLIRRKNLDISNSIFNNHVNYDRHLDIEELHAHVNNQNIVRRVVDILGQNILCWRTEFFPKFPKSTGTEWHQVANYQYANGKPMLEPTVMNNEDITVWTAFTDTTIKTACMRFLPGSHKIKYYDESKAKIFPQNDNKSLFSETEFYGYNFSEFKIDPKWSPENEESVDIEMKAGECIIFTAKCVHASYPNESETFTRFAISSRYIPTHVKVYPNIKKYYAHGAWFDLQKYSCLLVSGKDIYGHNKIK